MEPSRYLKDTIKKVAGTLGIPLPRRRLRGRRPRMLSVEVTSRCNLNCPFCLVGMQNQLPSTEHDLLPRGLGTMELDLHRKILGDAVAFGIDKMQLHFQGEPLLHKQLPEMVRLAKDRGLLTQMFTNGLPLTEPMADRLLDAGLDMLRFSVDGVSEEVYQKNRVGGQFWRVRRNMAMMAQRARQRRSPIRLEWQMIAMRNNEHEIDAARAMSAELGLNFFVKTFAVTDPDAVPRDQRYQRQLHLKPCLDIYRAIFVYYNGDVVPCCYDIAGKAIVGNLGRQSLTEVWNSAAYVDLRRRIDGAGRRPDEEPELCRSCLKWGHERSRTSDGKTVWGGEGAGMVPDDDDAV
ncbi:MAG TPA: radical SAM protein [Methylomirabilota bacterium]